MAGAGGEQDGGFKFLNREVKDALGQFMGHTSLLNLLK